MNHKTVISLGDKNVNYILEKYNKLLKIPNQQGIKRAHFSGLLYGFSQAIRFAFVAITFYLASVILEKADNPEEIRTDVFTAVYVIFVGAIGVGVSVS